MRTGRLFISLALGASAAWLGGCTIYTHSSGEPSQPSARHHNRPSGSHGSSSGSSSSASGSSSTTTPGDTNAPPTDQGGTQPDPASIRARLMPKVRGDRGDRGPRAAEPALDVPPWSTSRPQILLPGAATGRPDGFRPGAPAAYWIWQGPRGDWMVRTTTAGAAHLFRGRLKGVTGGIVNVHPTKTEFRDRIAQSTDGWMFNFRTDGHADGFTFGVQGSGCVEFDLQLDGGPVPKRIIVGQKPTEPKSGHFIVCPQNTAPPATGTTMHQ